MKFQVITSAQVERNYTVEADSADHAKERLRIHLKDSSLLREGIVEKAALEQNVTPERIKSAAIAVDPKDPPAPAEEPTAPAPPAKPKDTAK